jgi:hypothetical protein
MAKQYHHDVFLSYTHQDKTRAKRVYKRLNSYGVSLFWDKKELKHGISFPNQLAEELLNSHHFVLLCNEHTKNSEWVGTECEMFFNQCHVNDKENRRMFVLLDENCREDNVPHLLKRIHRCMSDEELFSALLTTLVTGLRADLNICKVSKDKELSILSNQIEAEVAKVRETRCYLRDTRFWDVIALNNNVHIYTCGRDIGHSPDTPRGYGGRTSIDVWDYRSVLDITHYFVSRFPNARITIEDPASKISSIELREVQHLKAHIANIQGKLKDKDCIIVGSPDVNDFAEVLLSSMHGIDPYTEGRKKNKGFAIIKKRTPSRSSFYWQTERHEQEGVARILDSGQYEYFPQEMDFGSNGVGVMHGILVLGNNPFCTKVSQSKVVVLSGFSGVATNAITKLLTDDKYIHEYFKLGSRYFDFVKNVEVLVKVEYEFDHSFSARDTRHIRNVSFDKLVEI